MSATHPQRRGSRKRSDAKLVAAIAVGTAAYLYFLYWPVEREIDDLRAELKQQQSLMEQALLLPAQVGRIKEDLERTGQFVSAWRNNSRDESARMYGAISQAIAASGASTTQFQPESNVDRAFLREIAVRVSCRGTLKQLFASLCALESLPWTVWIEDLRLTPDREDQANLAFEMKLGIFAEKSDLSD